ncbi:hypothetical protein [Actinoplanes sp. NPDC026623]|uniref:hypothetical protein n=1 Tax=Actinoplanes sp. NPDC026623 TaxID=3155610 RepID=UPI0033C2A65C
MEISSDDGARLRIRPLGYQFGVAPPGDPDESEDWLDVAPGDLVRAAGQWADEIAPFPPRTA